MNHPPLLAKMLTAGSNFYQYRFTLISCVWRHQSPLNSESWPSEHAPSRPVQSAGPAMVRGPNGSCTAAWFRGACEASAPGRLRNCRLPECRNKGLVLAGRTRPERLMSHAFLPSTMPILGTSRPAASLHNAYGRPGAWPDSPAQGRVACENSAGWAIGKTI